MSKSMANRSVLSDTYSIYPTVQNITYSNNFLSLSNKVNIVFNDDVDVYTKEKAYHVVSLKNVISHVSNSVDDSKTNLVLGIYSNSDLATNMVSEDISYINNKIDAYYLEINEDNIILVGKDSDALFYGLSSLEFIFEQSDREIHGLKIKDYAQSELRGFIEGYYGIPWTSKERKELMKFGSKVKNNIYIYAPKDDVYHSTSWRSLYNENDYELLKEQVEVGRETKTRLAWAIHPFMNNPLTAASYSTDVEIIKAKFEQVYQAGVRQFVLSADDINMFDPTDGTTVNVPHHANLHKQLANELSAWVKSKGDCYRLVYVPTTYNNMDNMCAEYYQYFMDGLDESISIMWTGAKVCSSMNNMAYDEFHSYTGTDTKPFIWMNWPVNDYAINYLLMGEGEVFNKTYTNDDDVEFSGLVVNPMQLAEASKISIWACGDYSWNTHGYNRHQSYIDSFKYIEEDETEAFIKVAEHLTNTSSKFEDNEFLEAESLKPLISLYKEAYESGNYQTIENTIKDYLDDLVNSCNSFVNHAKNRKLVANIEPWVQAVKYTALAAKQYMYLVRNFSLLNDNELRDQYETALDLLEQSRGQVAKNLIPGFYSIEDRPAYACTTVLTPFMTYLSNLVSDDIAIRLGYDTGTTYANLGSIHEGKLENITDGNENTYCWFGSSSSTESYVRIDLVVPTEVRDVTVVFGNEDPNSLDMMYGDIEVSLDAKNWTKVGETSSNRNVADIRDNPITARFIRLRCTTPDSHWVAIREIYYNTLSLDDPMIKYSGLEGIFEGSLDNMVDCDLDTVCWFSSKPDVDGYILIDYLSSKEINDISIYFGTNNPSLGYNDKFTGLLQYYDSSSSEWVTIGELNDREVSFDLRANPINTRYLRMLAIEDVPGWVAVREIAINQIPADEYLYLTKTMVLEEGDYSSLWDNDNATFCHFSKGTLTDASITLDLRSVKEINKIIYKQSSSEYSTDIIHFFNVSVSDDNVHWTQINENVYQDVYDLDLDLSGQNISARYIKISAVGELITWVAITEFDVNR